ncbi:hypothetical protein H5410_023384 [Solanum commersonii]|uniref:F-box domain-containing protein n=1 Tax=Solanum commersonii TaxID=4109 RepID=A0A9J5ZIY3_SOLCO|nr:hypothetical protein H5410_023384 [Solanum commersonii]
MDGRSPLPEDLVVDILLRLPGISLLHFKCVCKHRYALIKSPSFIEKHFHHKNNRARLLVRNSKVSDEKFVVFSLLPKEIVPDTPSGSKDYNYKCVTGPVDGLFLVQKKFYGDDVRLDLWNPATREFRNLYIQ